MKHLVEVIAAFALTIGGPGLFLIAFLDSSFLSFPEINDLLVIWMVVKNPTWMPYYAGLATLGSVTGCLVLYAVAARGGAALVSKRMHPGRAERARQLIQRHGVLTVLVPSLLPPPAPFKIFVLLSGIARVPWPKFALAIAVGRGVRYFGQGILAVWYGEQAIAFLSSYGREISLVIATVALVGALTFYLWRRLRHRPPVEA